MKKFFKELYGTYDPDIDIKTYRKRRSLGFIVSAPVFTLLFIVLTNFGPSYALAAFAVVVILFLITYIWSRN